MAACRAVAAVHARPTPRGSRADSGSRAQPQEGARFDRQRPARPLDFDQRQRLAKRRARTGHVAAARTRSRDPRTPRRRSGAPALGRTRPRPARDRRPPATAPLRRGRSAAATPARREEAGPPVPRRARARPASRRVRAGPRRPPHARWRRRTRLEGRRLAARFEHRQGGAHTRQRLGGAARRRRPLGVEPGTPAPRRRTELAQPGFAQVGLAQGIGRGFAVARVGVSGRSRQHRHCVGAAPRRLPAGRSWQHGGDRRGGHHQPHVSGHSMTIDVHCRASRVASYHYKNDLEANTR